MTSLLVSIILSQVPVAPPETLMSEPGKLLFHDTFAPGTASPRWFFKKYWTLEGETLKRSAVEPEETVRVFMKDAAFRDVIIRFDFRFDGTADLRLVTGGGGSYNTIVQVHPDHFQVNTGGDKKANILPSIQGECAATFEAGTWYTMTVEFSGEHVVAHLDPERFITGIHPIIDRERTYFAFQVANASASFDNVSICCCWFRSSPPRSLPHRTGPRDG